MFVGLRREVRTCASHCDCSLHPNHPTWLSRHMHLIHKSKNTKYTRWTGPQPIKPCFVALTYGSRTANRTDSLYQTVNGLVGNVDWGESLSVVTCEFPRLNSSGTRRRAAIKCLALELNYPRQSYQQMFRSLQPNPRICKVRYYPWRIVFPSHLAVYLWSCLVINPTLCRHGKLGPL